MWSGLKKLIEVSDIDMSHWHELSSNQVLRSLNSRADGLSNPEVKARHEKFGPNELPREKAPGWLIILLQQFKSPFMYILLFAAAVSLFFGDLIDAGVIAAAVVVNTLVGFIQEFKASKALDHLRSLVKPVVRVRRGGSEISVSARAVVPGDILILEAGDHIAADARMIESILLETNEAALTGESLPIKKSVDSVIAGTVLAERTSMLYAGTVTTGGRGEAVVVTTGVKTELGKIALLVAETKEEDTPLQVQLARLAKFLTIIFVVVSVLIFLVGIISGRDIFEMFLTSVALAVAAVPEGLLVAVTVIFAIGMQRILRRRALVRKLVATETLGSVSVICTDKTGTITEARMAVTDMVAEDKDLAHQIALLCNDAVVGDEDKELEELKVEGSPTEAALMRAALSAGLVKSELEQTYPRLDEIPFDSKYKYMATLHEWEDSQAILLKGAPERVLELCQVDDMEKLLAEAEQMTRRGLRVLAVAFRKLKTDDRQLTTDQLSELTFAGFFGLRDPIRSDAKETIAKARAAGVRTVVITGDHPDTAAAIAKEVGVGGERERIMIGPELDKLSDEELAQHVVNVDVYARVEPAHKVRIVQAWRARGEVVSMTGDGVNDAPALKAADIGVAQGNGTEVTKSIADVVLINGALTTIVAAIEQGRVIFDNIRKVTVYLLVDSFTEIVLIGSAVLMGLPLPLLPAHILWINLITDGFPSMALTLEPGEPDVMKEPPRPRKEPILNREMKILIFLIGIITDIGLLGIFLWLLGAHEIEYVRTIIFTAIAIDSLLYVFAIKSFRHSIFHINPFSNKWLVIGVIAGFLLQVMAVSHPFFQHIFELVPLHLNDWLLLLAIACVKLVAIEVAKWFFIVKQHRARSV